MSYTTLSEKDCTNIRKDRIRALEIEHMSIALLLEEEPENTELQQRMNKVVEYLTLHIGKLSEPSVTNQHD